MSFGLTDDEWQLACKLVLDPLREAGCSVWIFGSRATGKHRRWSDLDICFERTRPLMDGLLSNILEAAEESNLPIKIDLVDWADMADEYRDTVLQERRLVL